MQHILYFIGTLGTQFIVVHFLIMMEHCKFLISGEIPEGIPRGTSDESLVEFFEKCLEQSVGIPEEIFSEIPGTTPRDNTTVLSSF